MGASPEQGLVLQSASPFSLALLFLRIQFVAFQIRSHKRKELQEFTKDAKRFLLNWAVIDLQLIEQLGAKRNIQSGHPPRLIYDKEPVPHWCALPRQSHLSRMSSKYIS